MAKKAENAISPTRSENYPEWYQQVIKASDLAETSPVRGCMVIKPWGYALWENFQRVLDKMFKDTVIRTRISRSSFRSASCKKKLSTWKGLQRNVRSSRIIDWKPVLMAS